MRLVSSIFLRVVILRSVSSLHNRIILNSPITPFTVLFCHVVAHPATAHDDLCLLAEFVGSLRPSRNISEGVDKLYRIISVFHKVAELYVEAKENESTEHLSTNNIGLVPPGEGSQYVLPASEDFDQYLAALGFAPQAFQTTSDNVDSATDGYLDEDRSWLQDWYSGSQSLMGLLEFDLEQIGIPEAEPV